VEEAFRFNERKDSDGGRFRKVLGSVSGKRIMYTELIGREKESSEAGDDQALLTPLGKFRSLAKRLMQVSYNDVRKERVRYEAANAANGGAGRSSKLTKK
jgi:hypothetical protein